MALTYNIVDYRGKAVEPILEEILFEAKTISEGLVTLETDVKNETIFTEASATATMQAFSSGAPSSSGSLDAFDVAITPYKYMYYQEFDPNTLRPSRFKQTMKPGAWEMLSSEFEKVVIGSVLAKNQAYDLEYKFWNNVTSSQKSTIAGLTPGTGNSSIGAAEQTWTAARTAGLFNGVIASMLYNSWNASATAGVGTRVKVAGTTVTSSNIATEFGKVYAAIPAEVLQTGKVPYIYAPHSYLQLINIYNTNATYRDLFSVQGSKYFYNNVEIKFVPLAGDVMIAAPKEHIFFCTDLAGDNNKVEVNKIANNREDMFIKSIATVAAYVGNQSWNVLYIG